MFSSRRTAVWILVLFPVTLAAAQPRVRPLDRAADAAYRHGLQQSASFRTLVSALEDSDVIVHVVTVPVLPGGITGRTRFVAALGGRRYLRIELVFGLAPDQRTAVLGHELQHACELADSDALSISDVEQLFRRIGQRVSGVDNAFDTDGALKAGLAVWADLRTGARRQTIAGQ